MGTTTKITCQLRKVFVIRLVVSDVITFGFMHAEIPGKGWNFYFFFQPITIVWKHPTARSRTFFVINFISLTALNPWSQQLGVLEGYIFVKLSEKSTTGNLDAGNWGRAYSYFVPPRDPLRVQRMFLRSKGSPVETPSSNGNHAKASAPLS